MIKASLLLEEIKNGQHDEKLADLYADAALVPFQKERYAAAIERFIELYGDLDVAMFSAAGRSEVSGNHTDHQHGRVLAASINLDSIAVVALADDVIEVVSDGFEIAPLKASELEYKAEEEGTSESLIKGVLAGLKDAGYNVGGFKAFITSNVVAGAGLSSSASFEDLIGTIQSGLYNEGGVDSVTIAKISQWAENNYFGKPCGLMDQCACQVGGLISIDFADPAAPVVKPVDADFSQFGYSLCIVDTKGSHADLTPEYAAVPAEMKAAARVFGKEVLREVDPKEFFASIDKVRQAAGDRAVVRAIHFFNENDRVPSIVAALEEGNFEGFLEGIQNSGRSSFQYLQNVFPASDAQNQALSIGLAVSDQILPGHGVSRVHGGGFAGTIQAFVQNDFVDTYRSTLDGIFGEGSCHVLKIRKDGGVQVF